MEPNEPTSITLEILKKIHEGMGDLHRKIDDGLAGVRDEVAGVRDEVAGVRDEVAGLRDEVRGNSRRIEAQGRRIAAVETRMHDLVQVATLSITRQLDLGQRVDAIEKRVEALEGR